MVYYVKPVKNLLNDTASFIVHFVCDVHRQRDVDVWNNKYDLNKFICKIMI